MGDLSIDNFEEFFVQVWKKSDGGSFDPFPWQLDLVRQVDQDRCWPGLVDLPTGSGKTSLIDIAVFLLALDAELRAECRWMPRRIVLVVDRRVVVDQADQRGAHLAQVLATATSGVVKTVAERLQSLSGDGPPLVTTVLRGGMVRDETWAHRPDVPAIISSTVDQVGSRLLFRGYGLSSSMQPIHAGLLGNDVLFLLDEVHLARPFAEMLGAVDRYRRWRDRAGDSLPDRWHVVQLTATPTMKAERPFPSARLDPGSHTVLERRLRAPKPATLEIAKVAKDSAKANQQLAAACVKLALIQLRLDHVNTLAVIVNRVDAARHVARLLAAQEGDRDVVLLTGRMRSLDRDRLLRRWGQRLNLGRERHGGERELVVVATQSMEAGADFDFDGIVTECASLDALRQRFGRVDRDGQLSLGPTPSSSVIVIRSTDVGAVDPDPVYGHALAHTWAWLTSLDSVDFGIESLATNLEGVDQLLLVPPPSRSPRLLPGHLDQWVQTSHRPPSTEALVARWLHGMEQDDRLADVELVWREDLDPSLLARAAFEAHEDEISARVAACPPVSGESLAVSIGELRRWAAREPSDPDASDASSAGSVDVDDSTTQGHEGYLRWAHGEIKWASLSEVRPGDTLMLPAALGGIWSCNWDPSSRDERVIDLALEATSLVRRRAVARLCPGGTTGRSIGPDPEILEEESRRDRSRAMQSHLKALATDETAATDEAAVKVFTHLAGQPWHELQIRLLVDHVDDGVPRRSYVVTTRRRLSDDDGDADMAADDGADGVSFTGVMRQVTLDDHLEGVGSWARLFATNLGFDAQIVSDLRLAGQLHDLGKADPRFQRWLCGGDSGPLDGELLAKSSTADTDRVARQKARDLSHYPKDARHELLSLALIDDAREWTRGAHDPELVRFLLASHHGFGRYRFTPSIDPAPETVRFTISGVEASASSDHGLICLDAGVPDLFWRLVRRYGWYGLTWLETVLRLADHHRSRLEQTVDENDRAKEPA